MEKKQKLRLKLRIFNREKVIAPIVGKEFKICFSRYYIINSKNLQVNNFTEDNPIKGFTFVFQSVGKSSS